MFIHLPRLARSIGLYLGASLLFLVLPLIPATAQVSVSAQGGVHAARMDRPEREWVDPAQRFALEGAQGEASAFGLRVGGWFSDRWGVDGGVALSRNSSWQGGGSVDALPEEFETQLLFTSAALRFRITAPDSRVGLAIGAGPAVIFHGGDGTSLLTRTTDFGGLVDLGGSVRLASRLDFTLNVQQYLFSSSFAEVYVPPFVGQPLKPAGSQFRHEVVLLAGVSWRFD
jgi:hypothetical protein